MRIFIESLLGIAIYLVLGWITKDIYFSMYGWETTGDLWTTEITIYGIVALVIVLLCGHSVADDKRSGTEKISTRAGGTCIVAMVLARFLPISIGASVLYNILFITAIVYAVYIRVSIERLQKIEMMQLRNLEMECQYNEQLRQAIGQEANRQELIDKLQKEAEELWRQNKKEIIKNRNDSSNESLLILGVLGTILFCSPFIYIVFRIVCIDFFDSLGDEIIQSLFYISVALFIIGIILLIYIGNQRDKKWINMHNEFIDSYIDEGLNKYYSDYERNE